MKNISMFIEESIWGQGNVPMIIKRKIGAEEYRQAKEIVNEYECEQLSHEGHYKCTDKDCIL
jgi:hypothetical protein